jgi:hypothetical protein
LVLVAPIVARAESTEEARRHFDRGVELLNEERPAEAAVEFQRSYEIRSHYGVLYNLGLSYLMLNPPKTVEAVDILQRYLDEGGASIPATRRTDVEQEIARQKRRIATLEIRGAPDGAVVRVGDRVVGKAPLGVPVRVGIGTHVITVTPQNKKPIELSVTVAGEDYRIIELAAGTDTASAGGAVTPETSSSIERSAAGVAKPTSPDQLEPPAPPRVSATVATSPSDAKASDVGAPFHSRVGRVAGLVTAGVGMGGLVAGVVIGLLARSRNQSALDRCPQAPCSESARALQNDAKDFATGANISFIAGGALVLTGAVLYLLAPGDKPSSQNQARLLLFAGHGSFGLATRGIW